MAADRSATQAVNGLVAPLQRSLSCVTRAVLLHPHDPRPNVVHWLRLSQYPAPLDAPMGLVRRVWLDYDIMPLPERRGWWVAEYVAYRFELAIADGIELLAYHWHPLGRSPIAFPHLHLGPALAIPSSPAANAHLPTGLVSLPEVLRLAITDLGVRPLRGDWQAVLAAAQSPT